MKLSVLLLSALVATLGVAQSPSPTLEQQLDSIANKVLADTGVPSASVALVKNGQVVLTKAYGKSRLEPSTPAQPALRYSVGSISKQFTAAAAMMLVEQGKLSLDDKVGKYLPDLTRANEVTIREILSHTSGYQDYFPQDYVPTFMLKPTTAQAIMDRWAKKPLDFDPGTKWQYSNTNFVIAGAIIEKITGASLFSMLEQRIFEPLGMTTVFDYDSHGPANPQATGFTRYALGPLRPAPKEGTGWMFAAGELSMTAADLAKWDISMINESVLKPASYRAMETEVVLTNGLGSGYGLGLSVLKVASHRALEHSGEVSGFVSENIVLPDDHAAVVVLTNEDASEAAASIGRQIAAILLHTEDANAVAAEARARSIFEALQGGKIDRSLFTADGSEYFTEQALQDYQSSLSALGKVESFKLVNSSLRGGMYDRAFRVTFANGKDKSVIVSTYEMPDGKLEQYLVIPVS